MNELARVVTERSGVAEPEDPDYVERRSAALVSFDRALRELSSVEDVSFETFRALCHEHLEALGTTDVVARVAYNLALDFRVQQGPSVVTRGETLLRFAQGYLQTVNELRTASRYRLNMPFLLVGDAGPIHYERVLDVPTLIALAEREPVLPTAEAPKAGFWSRVFGGGDER